MSFAPLKPGDLIGVVAPAGPVKPEALADVAALYDVELNKLGEEPARFVDLGLRLAQIFETQLEDVENAVTRYRRVLGVEAENVAAISSLDRLFSATERWTELVPILVREAEISQSPDEVLELKYRLGVVYQTRLGDVAQAIAAYREVLTAAPDHQATREALEGLFAAGVSQTEIGEILEPLYQSAGEWDKLALEDIRRTSALPTSALSASRTKLSGVPISTRSRASTTSSFVRIVTRSGPIWIMELPHASSMSSSARNRIVRVAPTVASPVTTNSADWGFSVVPTSTLAAPCMARPKRPRMPVVTSPLATWNVEPFVKVWRSPRISSWRVAPTRKPPNKTGKEAGISR